MLVGKELHIINVGIDFSSKDAEKAVHNDIGDYWLENRHKEIIPPLRIEFNSTNANVLFIEGNYAIVLPSGLEREVVSNIANNVANMIHSGKVKGNILH